MCELDNLFKVACFLWILDRTDARVGLEGKDGISAFDSKLLMYMTIPRLHIFYVINQTFSLGCLLDQGLFWPPLPTVFPNDSMLSATEVRPNAKLLMLPSQTSLACTRPSGEIRQ